MPCICTYTHAYTHKKDAHTQTQFSKKIHIHTYTHARIHTDEEVQRVAEPSPPAKCGKNCTKNAHEIFERASDRLGDLLPGDVAWEKYPKSLVLDSESQEARVNDALNIDTFDPLGNADVGIVDGYTNERQAEFDQVRACTHL